MPESRTDRTCPAPFAAARPRRPGRRTGFTLVEILVVVVILGVLAAIVIPQFSSASETARANSVTAILKTLRAQLELYHVHHERYPELDQLWVNLLEQTGQQGQLDPEGRFGPYLQKPPLNTYTGSTRVVALGQGTGADGWEYDEATGEIRAVGFDEETRTFVIPDN